MAIAYRGEGSERAPGCSLQAHYLELQAIGDALTFAAQRKQAEQLERKLSAETAAREAASEGMEAVASYVTLSRRHELLANYWYGVASGYRRLLRAVDGNIAELEAIEREVLERIVWDHDPPYFDIPGVDLQGKLQLPPREEPEDAKGSSPDTVS